VRAGAADLGLTPNAGLAVVSELCDRLGVIGALDAAVGPIKQRDRGLGAGELLTGLAAAQLAGEISTATITSSDQSGCSPQAAGCGQSETPCCLLHQR
jgi:hypothetical protein